MNCYSCAPSLGHVDLMLRIDKERNTNWPSNVSLVSNFFWLSLFFWLSWFWFHQNWEVKLLTDLVPLVYPGCLIITQYFHLLMLLLELLPTDLQKLIVQKTLFTSPIPGRQARDQSNAVAQLLHQCCTAAALLPLCCLTESTSSNISVVPWNTWRKPNM